jgi:hypothetical protein
MSPATRAAFEARIERLRLDYASFIQEAQRLEAARPEQAQTAAYERAWDTWEEFRRLESLVDQQVNEFTRRPTVRISKPQDTP